MLIDNNIDRIVSEALRSRSFSHSPYSKFPVGAAILCGSGKIFTGTNVENVSFGLTICAERAAACSAISAGEREFVAIAIAADSEEPVVTCGACRQFLAEFAPGLTIISSNLAGMRRMESLSDLLPEPRRGILK